MKKSLIVTAILVLCLAFAKAQSPKEISVNDFHTVKVFDLITVNLVKSDAPKIVITGEDAEYVEIVEKDGLLKVRMESERIFDGNNTFVYVHYTNLDVIDGNEGAVILSNELIDQSNLEIRVQEGARVTAGLSVENLKVRAVTGGIVELKGVSKYQEIVVNTGGIAENTSLKTEHSKVKVQAGGEVEVYATSSVDINVRAGGDVMVYGSPIEVKKKTFLGGRIEFID